MQDCERAADLCACMSPAFEAFVLRSSTRLPFLTHVRLQSMIHQENPALVINTGSKQGITNPPYVAI